MKLSLAWVFDHLMVPVRDVDVAQLVRQLSGKTTEIDRFYKLDVHLDDLFYAHVVKIGISDAELECPELGSVFRLSMRADIMPDYWYLVHRTDKNMSWAHLKDLGAEKDGLMPAVSCGPEALTAAWRTSLNTNDWIIEISSTAITHRPDLWGARGFAREIAAIRGWRLRALDELVASDIRTHEATTQFHANKEFPYTIKNNDTKSCARFAALYVDGIQNNISPLKLAVRLACVDIRPINHIVDVANYVMLDLGQPLHTFDADSITSKTLEPRMAIAGQQLELLDGDTIELTGHDFIISDGAQPLSLAGIMGGAHSAVSYETDAVIIESACFDPGMIRNSSVYHHLRTDACMRFEKGLDQNHNDVALKRFAQLMQVTNKVRLGDIVSLGQRVIDRTIDIKHDYICQRIGPNLGSNEIVRILVGLGFAVEQFGQAADAIYRCTVPSFRGMQSITQPVDIVEEIARMYGFDCIAPELVRWSMVPCDNRRVLAMRDIKNTLAFGARMREVINYPFFDEEFIRVIGYEPTGAVRAKNPLSANVTRLVTSLVPHLMKNVQINKHRADELRFFEVDNIWRAGVDGAPAESLSIAGIWWRNVDQCDFYAGKDLLQPVFDLLGMRVSWRKMSAQESWQHPHQTARIMHGDVQVGIAGLVDVIFWQRVCVGSAFVFELDGQYVRTYKESVVQMMPLPQYPHTWLDISMLMPVDLSVDAMIGLVRASDVRIYDVQLRDIFEKDEWQNRRSITLRIFSRDPERTLEKRDIDEVLTNAQSAAQRAGASVR